MDFQEIMFVQFMLLGLHNKYLIHSYKRTNDVQDLNLSDVVLFYRSSLNSMIEESKRYRKNNRHLMSSN
jgi:hypothetical protein